MIKNTPLWRTIAVIGATSLALAACGDDGDGDTATGTEPTESASPTGAQATGDGQLVVGTLLPQTGSLAFLGPPEFAGVDLAVKEINEAGGVLGEPVQVIDADSGDTTTDIANQSVDRLLSQNVDVIVGAASSGVTTTVIDKITRAGVLQISPANTAAELSEYPDDGLYFRTAPADILQGRILADTILADGNATVGIMALQDPYGEGLAKNVTDAYEASGGEVVETTIYDPAAANYDAEVAKIKAADPAAIVLIGFNETAKIMPTLIEQGIGPANKAIYMVDGNTSNTIFAELPPGSVEGVKGTIPGSEATQEFRTRLLEVDPNLTDFSYAAESYDATMLVALAAVAAGDDSGKSIASKMAEVSQEGTECTAYAECLQLLEDGEDIDYNGVSGPIAFDENGDVTAASVGVYTYGADNKLLPEVAYQSGQL